MLSVFDVGNDRFKNISTLWQLKRSEKMEPRNKDEKENLEIGIPSHHISYIMMYINQKKHWNSQLLPIFFRTFSG